MSTLCLCINCDTSSVYKKTRETGKCEEKETRKLEKKAKKLKNFLMFVWVEKE